MTTNTASPTILFIGAIGALFESAKAAAEGAGRTIALAETQRTVNELLKTQPITLVIVDLALKEGSAKDIIDAIKKERRQLNYLAVTEYEYKGTSIYDVLAYNFYCIARGIDGTITVKQFEQALKKIEAQRAAFARRIGIGIFCIIAISMLAMSSGSQLGKFLGALWATALLLEFSHYIITTRMRRV